ncbi:MAG: hypothetical protein JWL65_621 [Gammaproteobacteria bacterium]|nr:hypothetical protein [Gammaproteobacteria bacterium]
MLDQLPDTDSMLEPKSTAQSGGVAGSTRHLTPEDLEAYANGRLASARLDPCRIHLDSCDACRAELEDLRNLKSELAGFQRSEPIRREQERRNRRRGFTLPQAVSVATIVAIAGAAIFWWERGSPWGSKTSAAVSVRQSPVASGAPPAPAARTATADPAAAPKLELPTHATGLPEPAPLHSGAPGANTGFALLGPFGETISETRPEFSWQPLPGAIRYSVVIVDVGLHPVQRSPSLRKTVWRPRRPLRRGRTYLWQVTATLRGGSKVVASEPSVSETLLRIVPPLTNGVHH